MGVPMSTTEKKRPPMATQLHLSLQEGRLCLNLYAQMLGRDLAVMLCGGDTPHIGALALASPRPSLTGNNSVSATASLLTLPGHKEDLLARKLALQLASICNTTVSMSCGIHLEQASPAELLLAENLAERLTAMLLRRIDVAAMRFYTAPTGRQS